MLKPLVSFDWAVKRLLRNKANFGILEGFLSELLRQGGGFRLTDSDKRKLKLAFDKRLGHFDGGGRGVVSVECGVRHRSFLYAGLQ